jgi:hypothetical protein
MPTYDRILTRSPIENPNRNDGVIEAEFESR